MELSEFNYYLPEELIAQTPILKRDESRLMILDKKTGEIEHKIFKDILEYLKPGDCLVRNNTKVIPARLYGKKDTGAKVEFVLLKNIEGVKVMGIFLVDNDKIFGEFKANADIDISKLAIQLGGGGHKKSAGFTSTLSLEKVLEISKDYIKKYI